MPSLTMERDHLAMADRHVARSRQNIAEAEERARQGQVTELSDALLRTMRAALVAHEDHRALIVRTIAALENGELPSRP